MFVAFVVDVKLAADLFILFLVFCLC